MNWQHWSVRSVLAVAYTIMNIRYASLILPIGVVAFAAYLADTPEWLSVMLFVALAMAGLAELITSAANGYAQMMYVTRDKLAEFLDEVESYANEEWVYGEDLKASIEDGEDEGEGGTPVRVGR